MILDGKKILVVGSGKSGVAAIALLKEKGIEATLTDSNEKLDVNKLINDNPVLSGVNIIVGELSDDVKKSTDCLILSPGVPTDLPWINEMRDRGVMIIGEIELGYICGKGSVIGITGTNGKTTTTTLTGEIMKAYYKHVDVVGNIGIPYTEKAAAQVEDQITVAEISSFQLETIIDFHPVVTAILNITPDHLNRHHTMEAYIKAKEDITLNQTKDDVCVLNYDSPDTRAFIDRCPATVIAFSSSTKLENGFYYEDGAIYRAGVRNYKGYEGKAVSYNDNPAEPKKIMNVTDMNLVGMCNIENVMAALAIAEAMNVPLDITLKVIRDFKAVEHRIEFVATKNGVDYYNDSKGTNPDAAIQGIKAMTKPTILIGGGYDKGSEYDDWIKAFDNKVKLLVLIGVTRDKIAECARKYGVTNIVMADTFEECMDICIKNACPGDAVLLSPACASWGMFDNYEQRGRIFKDIVRSIKEN